MKKNMGFIDRIVRVLIAVLITVYYFKGAFNGVLAIVLGIVALIFVVTSLLSYCPLYSLLGTSTKKDN